MLYVALSRLPARERRTTASYKYFLSVVGAYCGCLLIAPATAGRAWLITTIVIARLFLVSPLFLVKASKPQGADAGIHAKGQVDGEQAQNIILLASSACTAWRVYVVFQSHASGQDVLNGLFSHPAVSSLGCDLILSAFSYGLWTYRSYSRAQARTKTS